MTLIIIAVCILCFGIYIGFEAGRKTENEECASLCDGWLRTDGDCYAKIIRARRASEYI